MFLEAVTICVGYSDFLSETIPFVRPHLDRWLIVTSPSDAETQALCHKRGMECLVTSDFYRKGAAFDKARGIDHGMQLLTWKDWVLHIDSDIVFPTLFRESLEDACLDNQCIYGCDRFSIRGWEQWQRLKTSSYFDKYQRSSHCNVSFPEGFPVGTRWADIHQGYVPIGFFQLCHRNTVMYKGIRQKRYAPHGHNDAARTDVQYALQWDRQHRLLLPEVIVGHLESEAKPAPLGANWNGRKTPPFGPPSGNQQANTSINTSSSGSPS